MPSNGQVLSQIAKGINYLHKKGFTHGNLNPQTIVISQSQPVRIKVAEFGLTKFIGFRYSPDNENLTESDERESNNGTFSFDLGILIF